MEYLFLNVQGGRGIQRIGLIEVEFCQVIKQKGVLGYHGIIHNLREYHHSDVPPCTMCVLYWQVLVTGQCKKF